MDRIKQNREFVKSNFSELSSVVSDQRKGLPQPPLQKQEDIDSLKIQLPQVNDQILLKRDVYSCLKDRRSQRKYIDKALTIEELVFLLWATQGIDKTIENKATYRPVASAGARHPFETYLIIDNVEGLEKGVYRYLSLSHELEFLFYEADLMSRAITATYKQEFVGKCGAIFVWSCIPYRGEWRYSIAAHKLALLDAGHICQNLYVACEAVGCGTCAIAAYDQKLMDELIKVDGDNEFTVYLAPVGKL